MLREPDRAVQKAMAEKHWFWATLTLSSITILSFVFALWELVENHFFRDANYLTLHYLYLTRGFASSLLLSFWAAWFVLGQRKRSEAALRRSRERYLSLLEDNPSAVILYDSQLVVHEWNAAAERMYGYPREQVRARPLPTVPSARLDELREFMRRAEDGQPVLDIETTRLLHNGEVFPVQLSLRRHRESDGPDYFLEVTFDIRERVRWRDSMLELEKLASMGKMAAGTAHHLNSPLAALLLRVQLMREEGREPSDGDWNSLESGLKFCRTFVRRLLEFTRAAPVEKQNHVLAEIVESVANFYAPVIQAKGATLRVDTSEARDARVFADRNLIETILLTLLSNALDAVWRGGEIGIRTRCVHSGLVGFEIRDNGCGIKPAELARVFEPFFTTKGPGQGTGLGLAIAKILVLEHGGSIRIESAPGAGATAYVEFPAHAESLAPAGGVT